MGRPKKSVPAHVEPEDEVQESPEEEPARVLESAPIPKGAVSQSDAARAALDAGYEKPAQAVEYIKTKFGIDMNPQYFSAIKTRTKSAPVAAKAEPAKRGRKPREVAPLAAQPVAAPKPVANGQTDLLDALTAMKPLIAQYGAEQVKKMVDLLG
jgi:hypothetical protein